MNENQNPPEGQKGEGQKSKGSRRSHGGAGLEDLREAGIDEVDRLKELGGEEIDRLREMGSERLENLKDLGGDLGRRISDTVQERPFVAVGVAFGAGIVASSLLTSRIGRFAILAAGGYIVKQMLGEGMLDMGDDEDDEEERAPRPSRRARSTRAH